MEALLRPLQQEQVAGLQFFVRHVPHEGAVTAHQGENGEAAALAEAAGPQGATDEGAALGEHDLGDERLPHVDAGIAQVGVFEDVDALDLLHLDEVLHLSGDEDDVSLLKAEVPLRRQLLVTAADLQHLEFHGGKVGREGLLADERGMRQHDDFGEVLTDRVVRGFRPAAARQHARAEKGHVGDARHQNDQPDGRELEHAQRLHAHALDHAADGHIRRGADQCAGAAEDGGKGQRHEQAGRGEAQPPGQADDRPHKHRRDGGVVHESGEKADRAHQNGGQQDRLPAEPPG